jgi:hypothetical protein
MHSNHCYGPQTAVSSKRRCFHQQTRCCVLNTLRRRRGSAVRVKHSTTNVVPKTNTRCSFTQLQDPRKFTRRFNVVRVKCSSPNVDTKTNPRCSFTKPQDRGKMIANVRKRTLTQERTPAVRLRSPSNSKCLNENVDPETNTRCSFAQPEDPRAFTALGSLCSHRSERAKPCQDGTVIRERSNSKRSKRS